MGRWLPRIVGLLLMASALALALSRAPDLPVQSLVARWAPPPSEFIDLNGQLVHLRDVGPRGDAMPLVLLHGTSASLHTWEGWSRALQAQHRVISFDLPGFGLTGPLSGRYASWSYRGDDLARFVLELLDHLQVRRFAIAGNSLGGEVAWRVASLAPDRVQRLVLVDAAGYELKPESMPIGFRLAALPGANHLFEWLLPRGVVEASVRNVYGDPAKVTPQLVDRYFEITLRDGQPGRAGAAVSGAGARSTRRRRQRGAHPCAQGADAGDLGRPRSPDPAADGAALPRRHRRQPPGGVRRAGPRAARGGSGRDGSRCPALLERALP